MRSLIRRNRAEAPHDPAPSRLRYRYQRLMLTPVFRQTVRVGLPAFLVIFVAGVVLTREGNQQAMAAWAEGLRDQIESRPEFTVTGLDVQGANIALARAITDAVGVRFPVSSFDLDLDLIKGRVTELSAVRAARVRVRPGGTLSIEVEERRPVAVWRHVDGLRLLDGEGEMTGMIADRTDRPDLPLLAGDGAREATAEALALFRAARPIETRVRGLVRMGERRWDMILENGQRILLPEAEPIAALERVIALHEAQALLDRDIEVVDLRDGDRVTVRAGPMAVDAIRARHLRR